MYAISLDINMHIFHTFLAFYEFIISHANDMQNYNQHVKSMMNFVICSDKVKSIAKFSASYYIVL